MKKCLYLLNIDNYAPEVTALTYPLIKRYAHKIGAEIVQITERKFPDWPITYEKLQIHRLAQETRADWNIYIDSDALVHPECIDWTNHIPRDTIAHNGIDFAGIRWRYDGYFLRDGRNIGSCNWMTIASSWCIDLWQPLDISLEEALANIHPTVNELNTVITPEHLIDDYTLSRNIARYGLKVKELRLLEKDLGFGPDAMFFWHVYTVPVHDFMGVKMVGTDGQPGERMVGEKGETLYNDPAPSWTLAVDTDGRSIPELRPGKLTQMRHILKHWKIKV
jgi:hypothetical protein